MSAYAIIPSFATPIGDTGTDSGYTASSVMNDLQHSFWKTTPGGTITFVFGTGPSYSADLIGILVTSPNGLGMNGTLTIRLYSAGPTLEATISAPRHPALGLCDRRVIFFENESWKNTINRMEIDFPANSEVSYVATLYNAEEGESKAFRNLSSYLNPAWSVQINAIGKLGDEKAGFYYAESENLMNTKTFKGSLGPLVEASFEWQRFYFRKTNKPHLLIVPQVCQHDSSAYLQRLMSSSMVFGYLKGNYVATYAGKNDDNSSFLFTIPIEIEESV